MPVQTDPKPDNTMDSIAALAGVSRSTVSRVLTGDARVRDSTRRKVLEVVDRERYVPNRSARGLASGRAGMIGIVIPLDVAHLFADPYFATLLKWVYSAARAQELVTSLWILQEDDGRTVDLLSGGSMLDGAIIVGGVADAPIVRSLVQVGRPLVMIGGAGREAGVSYVDVDNRSAARVATAHLIRLGRRRIATISGPVTSPAGLDRQAGFLEALSQAGMEPVAVYEGDFSEASAIVGVQKIIRDKPDAIFAANDLMALAVMAELQTMGVNVPGEVAVVGFDDLPGVDAIEPPLTTVRQSVARVATESVRILTTQITDGPGPPVQVVFPTELIVRASCGVNL